MKKFSAFVAALLITAVLGIGIFAIGANALANRNTVAMQSAPGTATANPGTSGQQNLTDPQSSSAQVQQLQQQLSDTQAQLDQVNQQLSQYQALITALQQRGVIRIDQNGLVHIPNGFGDGN